MGRHLQRHRIALTACACVALIAAVVMPYVLPPGDGGATDAPTEAATPGREGGSDSDHQEASGAVLDEPHAADSGSPAITRSLSSLDVRGEAQAVLSHYRDEGDCVLARAGYVDLMGRVWSCTVQGDGWVDVCVIRPNEPGDGSVTTTVRMRRDEWEPEESLRVLGGSDDV